MKRIARIAALFFVVWVWSWAPIPAKAQVAIDSACSRSGWQRVPFSPDRDDASVYLLSAGRDRIYAAAHWGQAPNDVWQTLSAPFESTALTLLGTLEGQRLSDLLMTPAHPNTLAWAAGFGDRNLFGALAASPTGFSSRGTLTAWPSRLVSSGPDVFTLATRPDQSAGIYRWDGALPNGGDWIMASTDVLDAAGQPVRAAWASTTDATGRMWLGTDRAGIWTSTDGGSWEHRGSSPSLDLRYATVTGLSVSPKDPLRVAVGLGPSAVVTPVAGANTSRGVLTSADGGVSFGPPTFPGMLPAAVDQVTDLAYSQTRTDTLFATVWGEGLWVSHDGGGQWRHLGGPLEPESASDQAAAAASSRVYLSVMELVQPALDASCELLFVGGEGGLWVRDVSDLAVTKRIFMPWLNRGNTEQQWRSAAIATPRPLTMILPESTR
jgi:hypothetical protein